MIPTVKQRNEASDATPLDFVVQAVAEHTDTDPVELPELHQYCDGDVIDGFLRESPTAGELNFQWDDVMIKLSADQTVLIQSVGDQAGSNRHREHADS